MGGVLKLPRAQLGSLVFALLVAIAGAPTAFAGRAPKAKVSKSKSIKARIQTSRAPARTLGKRKATTRLRLRSANRRTLKAKVASRKSTGKLGATARVRARQSKAGATKRKASVQVARRAKTRVKTQGSQAGRKTGKWHKPLKIIGASIARLKANPRVSRVITFATKMSRKLTRGLDGLQARAPPWLAKSMSVVRTYNFSSIAAYMVTRVRNDKAFLGSLLVANSIVSNVALPGSIALGVDPLLAGLLNVLTTPVALGAIVLRERHNRQKAGETISVKETAKLVGREYRDFARARREAASKAAQADSPSRALLAN